jgi:hypothetical protein
MKIVAGQVSKVAPKNFFLAMAALEEFKTSGAGPKRSVAVQPSF